MNVAVRLRQLIEAEKAVTLPSSAGTRSWERLASAVTSGAPAIPVPLTTIELTTTTLIAKGGAVAVAVAVGAIGAVAVVGLEPSQNYAPAGPSVTGSLGLESNRAVSNLVNIEEPGLDAAVPFAPAQRAQPAPLPTLSNTSPKAPAASGPQTSTLDDELQLIARAKRELDSGQTHLAQVWLDEHRSRFPTGVLSAERDGLLVLMACGNTNSADAHARAQGYATKYPGSPLLDRIYRTCEKGSASEMPK